MRPQRGFIHSLAAADAQATLSASWTPSTPGAPRCCRDGRKATHVPGAGLGCRRRRSRRLVTHSTRVRAPRTWRERCFCLARRKSRNGPKLTDPFLKSTRLDHERGAAVSVPDGLAALVAGFEHAQAGPKAEGNRACHLPSATLLTVLPFWRLNTVATASRVFLAVVTIPPASRTSWISLLVWGPGFSCKKRRTAFLGLRKA